MNLHANACQMSDCTENRQEACPFQQINAWPAEDMSAHSHRNYVLWRIVIKNENGLALESRNDAEYMTGRDEDVPQRKMVNREILVPSSFYLFGRVAWWVLWNGESLDPRGCHTIQQTNKAFALIMLRREPVDETRCNSSETKTLKKNAPIYFWRMKTRRNDSLDSRPRELDTHK